MMNKFDKFTKPHSKFEVWLYEEKLDEYFLTSTCNLASDAITLAEKYNDSLIVRVDEVRTVILLEKEEK